VNLGGGGGDSSYEKKGTDVTSPKKNLSGGVRRKEGGRGNFGAGQVGPYYSTPHPLKNSFSRGEIRFGGSGHPATLKDPEKFLPGGSH